MPLSRWWGLGALGCYAVHAAYHVHRGHPEDLVWACHVGTLLVAFGLAARSPVANAIGFLWLVVGNVCWAMDLAAGGDFLPTSILTHAGGLVLGALGLRRMGLPRHAWWQALVGFVLLQQLSRWTTPPDANVNVAFRVWTGWEARFPSYPAYLAMLYAIALASFFVIDRVARRLLLP